MKIKSFFKKIFKKKDPADDIIRMPDGSGLLRTFTGNNILVKAKGQMNDKIEELTKSVSGELSNNLWQLKLVEITGSYGPGKEVSVKFVASTNGDMDLKKLKKLLSKAKLDFVEIDVKSNYNDTIIPAWMLDRR